MNKILYLNKQTMEPSWKIGCQNEQTVKFLDIRIDTRKTWHIFSNTTIIFFGNGRRMDGWLLRSVISKILF